MTPEHDIERAARVLHGLRRPRSPHWFDDNVGGERDEFIDMAQALHDAGLLVTSEVRDVLQATRGVVEAITNEGPAPAYHGTVMAAHREQWPTLWNALDALVRVWRSTNERNPQ